jgi:CSLREA domain-containing protein
LAVVFLVPLFLLLLAPAPAFAASIVVNSAADTVADDGVCTLREAITAANTDTASGATAGECAPGSGSDTITFAANYTIILAGSQLPAVFAPLASPADALTITGNGAANTIITAVDGPNTATYRVLEVRAGFGGAAAGTLTLDGVTVQRGRCAGGSCSNIGGGIANGGTLVVANSIIANNSAEFGGGIANFEDATLTVTDSTITGNSADAGPSPGAGGGIFNGGTLIVDNSTIADNTTSLFGGGIFASIQSGNGQTTVTNSTLSGNSAALNGGGIFNNIGTLTVSNSTLSDNSAGSSGGLYINGNATVTNSTISGNLADLEGGGLYLDTGNLTLVRSLVSGNSSAGLGAEITRAIGTITANTNNVFGHSGLSNNGLAFNGFVPGANDFNATSDAGTPVALASILDTTLADNGGPTQTHALVAGSPAIDFGPTASCAAAPVNGVDQRGSPRGVDITGTGSDTTNLCDSGSYELQPPPTATLTIAKETTPAGGQDFPFTIDPGDYDFDFKFGDTGTLNGQLDTPSGVALDAAGNIYVVDSVNNRVQKFDSSGNYVTQWGVFGTANGEFNRPNGVAIDAAGNIYVVDTNNNRVQKFDSSGAFLTQWGSGGSANSEFSQARGIAIDAAGDVYVVDAGNNRIQKFDSSGAYLTQWGSGGSSNGRFNFPIGVEIDRDGNVYVSDALNHRVQKFTGTGGFLATWGSSGAGNGQFNQPTGVAVDHAGNVYVNDALNHRVQKFTAGGAYLGQWGTFGSGDGELNQPTGLTVDAAGSVFVVDSQNDRVQVFVPALSTVLDDGQSGDFTLPPGDYLVSELVPDGWTVTNIVCDGGSPAYNDISAVQVTLAGGDDVTCSFENLGPATTGSIKVIKTVVGGAPSSEWSFSGPPPIENFTLPAAGGDTTFTGLTPGSFLLSETTKGGWVVSAACTGGETGTDRVIMNLSAGEAAECTFTNTQCQPGTYDAGGNACVPAPAGSFVDTPGATQPTACLPGTWQDQEGQTSCKRADPGFFVPGTGATSQEQCPQGTTSAAGATECTLIPATSFCPADDPGVATLRTDLLGRGQTGRVGKLTVPHYDDVASLYGQLAAVQTGQMKWVQFAQKGVPQIKLTAVTSPAVVPGTVRWWGTALSTDADAPWVKGIFTFGKRGNRDPRAFVLWPTYDTGDERYANAFASFDSPDNYAHFSTATQTLNLPPTQLPGADITVSVALVDVNRDSRWVTLTAEAGGVSQSRTITVSNSLRDLNVERFVLAAVPAGTDEVTITLTSPAGTGDSAAMIGASANYACGTSK